MNPDDLDPPRPVLKPVDLQIMSVQDLEEYIAKLNVEIERARTMIDQKQSHKSNAESLFKK